MERRVRVLRGCGLLEQGDVDAFGKIVAALVELIDIALDSSDDGIAGERDRGRRLRGAKGRSWRHAVRKDEAVEVGGGGGLSMRSAMAAGVGCLVQSDDEVGLQHAGLALV